MVYGLGRLKLGGPSPSRSAPVGSGVPRNPAIPGVASLADNFTTPVENAPMVGITTNALSSPGRRDLLIHWRRVPTVARLQQPREL
jgi:hypothetical protein